MTTLLSVENTTPAEQVVCEAHRLLVDAVLNGHLAARRKRLAHGPLASPDTAANVGADAPVRRFCHPNLLRRSMIIE
nr:MULTISPECIES: hypothetical protein [unclassified Streptomyces]